MSCLRYVLFVFTSSCRRTHVLFTLCSVRLYLQLFVAHVLFTLFVLFAYIGV